MTDYQYRDFAAEMEERQRRKGPSDEVRLAAAYAEQESQRLKEQEKIERALEDADRLAATQSPDQELHDRIARLADQAGESFRIAAIRHLKATHGTTQADYDLVQRRLSRVFRLHKELTGEDAGWRAF